MDKSKSFMNWGFNPNSGSNPTPYYLIFGGMFSEEGDAWCGMSKFSNLEDALTKLFDIWDDWMPWMFENVREYIEDGENLQLINDNGRLVDAQLNNRYFVKRTSQKAIPFSDNPHWINPRITNPYINIRNLVELSELRVGETDQSYALRVKKEYADYVKSSPVIQDYIKKLDLLAKQKMKICNTKGQIDRTNIFHNHFLICELKHWTENSGNTWKIVFSP